MTHDGMIQNPLYPTPGYVIKPEALIERATEAAAQRAGGHVDDFESQYRADVAGLIYDSFDKYLHNQICEWYHILEDDEDKKALWEALYGPDIVSNSSRSENIPF